MKVYVALEHNFDQTEIVSVNATEQGARDALCGEWDRHSDGRRQLRWLDDGRAHIYDTRAKRYIRDSWRRTVADVSVVEWQVAP